MKTITLTVSVDGNEVTRNYKIGGYLDVTTLAWGQKVEDMLDTIEKSKEVKKF